MSKDFILSYAKGETHTPDISVIYSMEADKIVIHSSKVIDNGGTSVLIRKNYDNQKNDSHISEMEVIQAAIEFMKK